MAWIEKAKKLAAKKAIEDQVKDGYIVGLGSGSTVEYAISELGRKVSRGEISIKVIPTSIRTEMVTRSLGIPITTLNEVDIIHVAIDGADQVDSNLNLIKGKGGALMREKIVDSVAERLVIIIDETKLVDPLGKDMAVPIEVLPFATPYVIRKLKELGGKPVIREGEKKLGPVITDNGNFIVDVDFGPIMTPLELERKLKFIPGIIETGLFIGMTHLVYVGHKKGVKIMEKRK